MQAQYEAYNIICFIIMKLSAALLIRKLSDNCISEYVTQAKNVVDFLDVLFILPKAQPRSHFTTGQKNTWAARVFRQYLRHHRNAVSNSTYYQSWKYYIHLLIQNLEETCFLSQLLVICIFKSSPVGSEVLKFIQFRTSRFKTFNFK